MNPEIPLRPCFLCGTPTSETHSKFGVGHYRCYCLKLSEKQIPKAVIANKLLPKAI